MLAEWSMTIKRETNLKSRDEGKEGHAHGHSPPTPPPKKIKLNNFTAAFEPGGGALEFQARYHSRKRTFKTHPKHVFFTYENRP